jgi:sodium-dependent phosphate transporter
VGCYLFQFVYRAASPGLAACRVAPIAVFTGVSGLSFMSFLDGSNLATAALKALGSGLLGAVVMHFAINQQLGPVLKSLKARGKPLFFSCRTGM